MSANQCNRQPWGILGDPVIYETFSVCALRRDPDAPHSGPSMYDAIKGCCTPGSVIKTYQCWNYCAVEESLFPTWLSCVFAAINSTQGYNCQRADQSPMSTATSIPVSFTQPAPPLDYTYPRMTTTTTHSAISSSLPATTTPVPSYSTLAARNATTTLYGSGEWNMSTNATATLVQVTNNESPRAVKLSVGGAVCAFLALSVFAL
ncbi:hypothetical protein BKA64DRAFT_686956 [Cadophora sp. MPI-SDFR-AT-0126]|nr:hypothetical protein BKA64DRAFT_686956 [Leotiomycetes sp. MPI-SDFR-AT-0126]